jgi:hypothetical protein
VEGDEQMVAKLDALAGISGAFKGGAASTHLIQSSA